MTGPVLEPPGPFIKALADRSRNRVDMWAEFLREVDARATAELGVYRGAFAAHMLDSCPALETYYMIDPWRHLDDWNKPANRDDETFRAIFDEAMQRTSGHERRRVVLRGRTTEVIDRISDSALDFAYIDADHTLRGITVDLVCTYPKIRDGGWIGGDDFSRSIWQHGANYEPTLVFPLAVYFAEAVGARIYGLPHKQFLIEKRTGRQFEFVDLTGSYSELSLLGQFASAPPPSGSLEPRAAGLVSRALRLRRR